MTRYRTWLAILCFLASTAARAREPETEVVYEVPVPADVAEGATEAVFDEEPAGDDEPLRRYSLSYFNIFYGPALRNTTSYQATPYGEIDPDRPVLFKNFLTLGYSVTDRITVSGTGHWLYQPVQGHELSLRDPFARVAHSSLLSYRDLNLYGDLRLHFPVTMVSRETDLRTTFQTFQALSWEPEGSRWSAAAFFSGRWSLYGDQGFGNDGELYLAPFVAYQFRHDLAFTMLYEMTAAHELGDDPWNFVSDGTDLEPGVSWDVTPTLNLNPYLTFFPGGRISLETISIGMMLSWKLI